MRKNSIIIVLIVLFALSCVNLMAQGALSSGAMPPPLLPVVASSSPNTSTQNININLGGNSGITGNIGVDKISLGLKLLALLTILSLAPAILMMVTSFTRIAVVLGFVRRALSIQEVPPNQIIIGLSLFLTFFIMAPTFKEINDKALQPYLGQKIGDMEALKIAEQPIREFMFKQTRKTDLALFMNIAKLPKPKIKADIPTYVLIPSFVISELKTAFIIGFVIYIPFLIIDMVISSILLSMGMFMLPPVLISLPFKLILFVLVDGWNLVIGSLIKSYF